MKSLALLLMTMLLPAVAFSAINETQETPGDIVIESEIVENEFNEFNEFENLGTEELTLIEEIESIEQELEAVTEEEMYDAELMELYSSPDNVLERPDYNEPGSRESVVE